MFNWEAILHLAFLIVLVYTLARIASIAFFQEKFNYHRKILKSSLEKGE